MIENIFKFKLLPPQEKVIELKKLFGDTAIDVIKDVFEKFKKEYK